MELLPEHARLHASGDVTEAETARPGPAPSAVPSAPFPLPTSGSGYDAPPTRSSRPSGPPVAPLRAGWSVERPAAAVPPTRVVPGANGYDTVAPVEAPAANVYDTVAPVQAPAANVYDTVAPVHEPAAPVAPVAPADATPQHADAVDGYGSHMAFAAVAADTELTGSLLRPPKAAATGASRPHRAFQLHDLPDGFSMEQTAPSPAVLSGIQLSCDRVSVYSKLVATGSTDSFTPAEWSMTRMLVDADAWPQDLGQATKAHQALLTKLRRQDLDVTDEGVLMHTVDGKREPYPVVDGKLVMDDRVVEYDKTPEDQAKTAVEFTSGLLHRSATSAQGEGLVDTAEGVTHMAGVGFEIFVVDKTGTIHMTSHKIGKVHHSSLLGGGDVAMGGEIKVTKGRIEFLNNKSGHYSPSRESLVQFLHFLEKDGIALDFGVFELSEGLRTTARALADGVTPDGTVDPKRTYTVIKTEQVWRALAHEFGEDKLVAIIEARGWRGRGADIVDAVEKPVDPKLVRRLLKQQLLTAGAKPARSVDTRDRTMKDGKSVTTVRAGFESS